MAGPYLRSLGAWLADHTALRSIPFRVGASLAFGLDLNAELDHLIRERARFHKLLVENVTRGEHDEAEAKRLWVSGTGLGPETFLTFREGVDADLVRRWARDSMHLPGLVDEARAVADRARATAQREVVSFFDFGSYLFRGIRGGDLARKLLREKYDLAARDPYGERMARAETTLGVNGLSSWTDVRRLAAIFASAGEETGEGEGLVVTALIKWQNLIALSPVKTYMGQRYREFIVATPSRSVRVKLTDVIESSRV